VSVIHYTPPRPDMGHQSEARRKARHRRGFGYFMEMGTGKSKTAFDEMMELFLETRIDCLLICAGKGSYLDWRDKHIPENESPIVPIYLHVWIRGSKRRRKKFDEWLEGIKNLPPGVIPVLLVSYDAIGASKTAREAVERFIKQRRAGCIADESTLMKEEDSNRTDFMLRTVRHWTAHRRILTGSPVAESPMDAWAQMEFLDRGLLGFSSFFSYRARFCQLQEEWVQPRGSMSPTGQYQRPGKKKVMKIVGYRNLDVLQKIIGEHSYRVLKSECLDLPPKIYKKIRVPMSEVQEELYRSLSDMWVAELPNTVVPDEVGTTESTAPADLSDDILTHLSDAGLAPNVGDGSGTFVSAQLAITRIMRLHQLACGIAVSEDGSVHRVPHNRVRELIRQIDESQGQVTIWCSFRPSVAEIVEELGRTYPGERIVEYHGGTKPQERAAGLLAFKEGRARFFVGTIQTGAFGIDLTASSTVMYYSLTPRLVHRLQSEDRNHRIGQLESVTYIDFACPGTVDEGLIDSLREKKEIADAVVGDVLHGWLRYTGEDDDVE
jgi:SNF2 family DNA or RNA helicase